MTPGQADRDPRPQLRSALDQLNSIIVALRPTDLERATPCAGFDVRTLLHHLVAVLRKLVTVRSGGDMTLVPDPAVDVAVGQEADTFGRARSELDQAWGDDAGLDDTYTLAWGTMTGRELLEAYAHEFTVHAWDLSQTVGRSEALDPDLAVAALAWFTSNVPAEGREAGGPFAPVVPVADDADPYTRLAGFVGRTAAQST